MGVRVKEPKKTVVPFLVANQLLQLLPALNAQTVGDFRRINGVLTDLEKLGQAAIQPMAKSFFEEHKLPEDEQIVQTHPLFGEWFKAQQKLTISIAPGQLQIFDEKTLDLAIAGRNLNVDAVRLLDEYLVKK